MDQAKRRARRIRALEKAETSIPITFAIVGVQKAATTTLYRMLSEHPDVETGPDKEMRFFIQERNWADPDYSTYRRPVLHGGRVAGDATPAYLFWPGALQRMREYNPAMRLMAIYRDPIERAFSQWAMERKRRTYPDLPEAIELYAAEPLPPEDSQVPKARDLQQSMFARGLYGAQLERAAPLFPAEQWRHFEFREFLSAPTRYLDVVTDLLEIPRFETYPETSQRMAAPTVTRGTPPSVSAVEGLVQRYADDLALFERLSGLDISSWPTRQVIDGSLSLADLHARLCAKLAPAT